MRVRRGRAPRESTYSAASSSPISISLMSMAPRPQMKVSSTWPEKASWVQSPSVPGTTGTTSWCAMSCTGANEGSLPGMVMRMLAPISS